MIYLPFIRLFICQTEIYVGGAADMKKPAELTSGPQQVLQANLK